MSDTIQINGQNEKLSVTTVAALLAEKEINVRGVAVALNGAVVPRADWPATKLRDGDTLEIVRALQGG
jgi:sulfur carrier protein